MIEKPFYASNKQAYTAILEETLKRFPAQKAQEKAVKNSQTFLELNFMIKNDESNSK